MVMYGNRNILYIISKSGILLIALAFVVVYLYFGI